MDLVGEEVSVRKVWINLFFMVFDLDRGYKFDLDFSFLFEFIY